MIPGKLSVFNSFLMPALLLVFMGSFSASSVQLPQEPEQNNTVRVINRYGDNRYVILLPMKIDHDVRLHILDMLGRQIKDTTYRKLSVPGELPMDGSGMRDGLYFLRINSGNYQWSAKMVKKAGGD
jgi:hypothetical protein